MTIEIAVRNPTPDRETALHAFQYTHTGCGPMVCHVNVLTNTCTLRCGCGEVVIFDQLGTEGTLIAYAATDGQRHRMREDVFITGEG